MNHSVLIDLAFGQQLLNEAIRIRTQAITHEEKLSIEANLLSWLEKVYNLEFELHTLKSCSYASLQELTSTYKDFSILLESAISKLRTLIDLVELEYATFLKDVSSLDSKFRRAKQKQATLQLWNNTALYTLVEYFSTLDNILDTTFQHHLTEGILTLPIRADKTIPITNLQISEGSNGQAGNSDLAVTTNNLSITNLLAQDTNLWFEYEKLSSGPLLLNIKCSFQSRVIINQIVIEAITSTFSGQVVDITFIGSATRHLYDVRGTTEAIDLLPKTTITFLPVEIDHLIIQLRQDFASSIETAFGSEKRYALHLQSISTHLLSFKNEANLTSSSLTIDKTVYAGLPAINIFPPNDKLFSLEATISTDNETTWHTNLYPFTTFLMDTQNISYKLSLSKDLTGLRNQTSYLDVDQYRALKSMRIPASTAISPIQWKPTESAYQDKIIAVQSKLMARGFKNHKLLLAYGTNTTQQVSIPILLDTLDIERLHIYVNGLEYTYQSDKDALVANEWSISDDLTELLLHEDTPSQSQIEAVLDPEVLYLEQTEDSYIATLQYPFDPDSVELYTLPGGSQRHSTVLPRDKTIINLPHKYLYNVEIIADSGTYTSVATRALALSTPNSYYIDLVNGLVWLNAATDANTLRIAYEHKTPVRLSTTYDVLYTTDLIPYGFKIPLSMLQVDSYTDEIGISQASIIQPATGIYGIRPTPISVSLKAQTLTYPNIIKGSLTVSNDLLDTVTPEEVSYVDGVSEFMGLINITDEVTQELPEQSSGVTTFTLAAGSLWYEEFGVNFNGSLYFTTQVGSALAVNSSGEYHISDLGLVTVYVGSGGTLPANIALNYYYRNSEFDPTNKYSVDYRNGILYSFSNLNTGATITYKVTNFVVAYEMIKTSIKQNYQNGILSIYTDQLHPINKHLKMLWMDGENSTNLENLADYFSPLINTFEIGFN